MTTTDQTELRRFVAAVRRHSGVLRCECRHGDDRCPTAAAFRVAFLCQVDDCQTAVVSRVACLPCKDSWLRQTRADPSRPRVRITRL